MRRLTTHTEGISKFPQRESRLIALFLAASAVVAAAPPAAAQEGPSNSVLWGTGGGGGAGPLSFRNSSEMHALNGQVAGQVNAAEVGLLLGTTTSISMTSIGSQNVISATVIGDNNDVRIDSENQTSTNSGDVRTDGTIRIGEVNQ